MACELELKGEIARVHMRMLDTPRNFDDVVVDDDRVADRARPDREVRAPAGQVAGGSTEVAGAPARAAAEESPRPRALAPLISELQTELTAEAERALKPGVEVRLVVLRGSLEVAAILTVGKLVIDAGAFLSGLREIRGVFPKRIRDAVSRWLGRDVAAETATVTVSDGALLGTLTNDTAEAAANDEAVDTSARELGWYALLATAVIVVTLVFIVGGVALMT